MFLKIPRTSLLADRRITIFLFSRGHLKLSSVELQHENVVMNLRFATVATCILEWGDLYALSEKPCKCVHVVWGKMSVCGRLSYRSRLSKVESQLSLTEKCHVIFLQKRAAERIPTRSDLIWKRCNQWKRKAQCQVSVGHSILFTEQNIVTNDAPVAIKKCRHLQIENITSICLE